MSIWPGTVPNNSVIAIGAVFEDSFYLTISFPEDSWNTPSKMLKESEKSLMNVLEPTKKAALSVVEVASLCLLSPSRFHALVSQGVFPKAVKASEGRRPHYPHDLVQRCLAIRSSGIGENGIVTLFNRPARKKADRKRPTITPATTEYDALIESLEALGLSVTADVVATAVRNVFPDGISGVEESDITRRVFLFLKGKRP